MNFEDKRKLKRSDIEKMLKLEYDEYIPNEWIAFCDSVEIRISKDDDEYERPYAVYINNESADEAFEDLEEAENFINKRVVNFICSALGVEE